MKIDGKNWYYRRYSSVLEVVMHAGKLWAPCRALVLLNTAPLNLLFRFLLFSVSALWLVLGIMCLLACVRAAGGGRGGGGGGG